MRHLQAALDGACDVEWFADADSLARALPGLLEAGDLVLVKGSAGTRLGKVVRELRALAGPVA